MVNFSTAQTLMYLSLIMELRKSWIEFTNILVGKKSFKMHASDLIVRSVEDLQRLHPKYV